MIYTICEDLDLNFAAMFAMTGLWNSFFLIIYSLLNASYLMKWSTRSTEEIFALFISIAFTVDAFKDVAKGEMVLNLYFYNNSSEIMYSLVDTTVNCK